MNLWIWKLRTISETCGRGLLWWFVIILNLKSREPFKKPKLEVFHVEIVWNRLIDENFWLNLCEIIWWLKYTEQVGLDWRILGNMVWTQSLLWHNKNRLHLWYSNFVHREYNLFLMEKRNGVKVNSTCNDGARVDFMSRFRCCLLLNDGANLDFQIWWGRLSF